MRERMEALLREAVGATESEFQAQLSESKLARLLFTLHTPWPAGADRYGRARASADGDVAELARSPARRPAGVRGRGAGQPAVRPLWRRLPASYRERVDARAAVPDIASIDRLARDGAGDLAMTLYRRLEDPAELLRSS